MSRIELRVGFGRGLIDAVQQLATMFPGEVAQLVKREVRPWISHLVDSTVRKVPRARQWPGDYPLPFTSDRQARWWFSQVKRRQDGTPMPYRRTNRYVRGWQVRGQYRQGFSKITVKNVADYAPYVARKPHRQVFHERTGWKSFDDIEGDIQEGAPRLLREGARRIIKKLVRQRGG